MYGACGGRAGALTGHGAQLPRTLLRCLCWSGSAHSSFGLECQRILPLLLLFYTLSPSFPSPSPHPLLLLLPLQPEDSLSLFPEGPLPLPELEIPTASSIWLLSTSVAKVFSSSRSADAMDRSGIRVRRDERFPRAEAAVTSPRAKAWQPM